MTRLNVHWSTLRRQSNLGQFRAKHMFASRRRDEVVVAAEATAPYWSMALIRLLKGGYLMDKPLVSLAAGCLTTFLLRASPDEHSS